MVDEVDREEDEKGSFRDEEKLKRAGMKGSVS